MSNLGKKAKLLCTSLILSLMLAQSPASWARSEPIIPSNNSFSSTNFCGPDRCVPTIWCRIFPRLCGNLTEDQIF